MTLKLLTDELLLESYCTAVYLGLDQVFLDILLEEIRKRKIGVMLTGRKE